jgi:hypothetical protein
MNRVAGDDGEVVSTYHLPPIDLARRVFADRY